MHKDVTVEWPGAADMMDSQLISKGLHPEASHEEVGSRTGDGRRTSPTPPPLGKGLEALGYTGSKKGPSDPERGASASERWRSGETWPLPWPDQRLRFPMINRAGRPLEHQPCPTTSTDIS